MLQNYDNDKDLWSSFLEGDPDAYSLMYNLHAKAMFSYGISLSFDKEAVEDAIQDVFVKIFSNKSNLKSVDNIRIYLFVALKNTLFNYTRKEVCVEVLPVCEDEDADVLDKLVREELQRRHEVFLENVFQLLPASQRQILFYRYYKELSYGDISTIMNINTQSAKNMVQTALKKIRVSYPYLFSIVGFIAFILSK